MHTMVTAPILTYSPNDITRAQSRAGEWNASFAFDVAFTATPSYLDVVAPNELLADSSLPLCNFTGAFCCNHQYSVTAITTSTGAIAERYAYTAYGQPTILNASGAVISATTLSNRYSYTGRDWDATLALHHFRARWMSPSAGRFLGRDPIGYVGSKWDLYEFVKSQPQTSMDPYGKLPIIIAIGGTLVIYELAVGVGCFIWASEQQDGILNPNIDPNTNYRNCLANCCINRFNAGVPIAALVGSIFIDPFPFDPDSQSDWYANFLGLLVSYNIGSSCLEGCDRFRRPWLYGNSCVVEPEPYIPSTPTSMQQLADSICSRRCRDEAISQTSGPGPEADRIYRECYDDCMSRAGY
jgi:RHS repeat-associated protein